jgi:MFS family permease
VPALVTAYLTSSTVLAMTLFALGLFVANAKLGVAPAAIHALFPSRMHGQASALYVALVSFFGLVAGPTIVASLTEHVFGGDMGTGKSLAVVSALASVVALALIHCDGGSPRTGGGQSRTGPEFPPRSRSRARTSRVNRSRVPVSSTDAAEEMTHG